jgi:hypothetical protein
MDEREWKDGKLVVEIQARGQGIIPELGRAVRLASAMDSMSETVDGNGLSVTEFVSDGKQRLPQADRNWQLTYRASPTCGRRDVSVPGTQARHRTRIHRIQTLSGSGHRHAGRAAKAANSAVP